jgi:Zn-dependent peptidase ImmA (M78 family)
MNIKLRVANLINKYGTCNPYTLSSYLGITVLELDLPSRVRGFMVRSLRRKYIALNTALPEENQKIVLCHELGHARLHPAYGYYYTLSGTYFIRSKKEVEANEYALHLLSYSTDINASLLAAIINTKRPDPYIVHQILSQFII